MLESFRGYTSPVRQVFLRVCLARPDVLFVGDVIAVKDGPHLVAGNAHGDFLQTDCERELLVMPI